MLDAKKPALEDDESYSRNFELVLKTALKFGHLFTEKETNVIKTFLNQSVQTKTLYARMYFRRRFWYTPRQLQKYTENPDQIDKALRILHSLQLLKSDEDCLYETDYERLHELFECMLLPHVKLVEEQFRRIHRGNFEPTYPKEYDCIMNNPFYMMKSSLDESPLYEISCIVSEKLSDQMRFTSEQVFATGKKVNVLFNYQVGDKVK